MGKTIKKFCREPLEVGECAPRKGHYVYQGSKTVFDSREKRRRTRQGQKRAWLMDNTN